LKIDENKGVFMNDKRFSLAEAFKFGLYMYLEYFGLFLALIITYLAIMGVAVLFIFGIACLPFLGMILQVVKVVGIADAIRADFIATIINKLGIEFSIVVMGAILAMFFVNRYLKLGFTKITFDLYDKNYGNFSTFFSCYRLIVTDVIASLLYFFMCFIGYILFIVPGIYCAITYGFYHQVIVDKQVGVLEAFKKSAAITHGAKWELLALSVLLFLIRALSLKLFGLTLLFAWPLTSLVSVFIYRKLSSLPPL
jgi:hypothetical protein